MSGNGTLAAGSAGSSPTDIHEPSSPTDSSMSQEEFNDGYQGSIVGSDDVDSPHFPHAHEPEDEEIHSGDYEDDYDGYWSDDGSDSPSAPGSYSSGSDSGERTPRPSGVWYDDNAKKNGPWAPWSGDLLPTIEYNELDTDRGRQWIVLLAKHLDKKEEQEKNQLCACQIEDPSIAWKLSHKPECEQILAARRCYDAERHKFCALPESTRPNDWPFVGASTTRYLNYWSLAGAYDYHRAKFLYGIALLRVESKPAVRLAVDQFISLLTNGGFDKWAVADYIPHLLLRLRRDLTCLQFLRFCDTPDSDGYDPTSIVCQHWADWNSPWVQEATRLTDAFLPMDSFWRHSKPRLSHLVALAFLKVSLHLDLITLQTSELQHSVHPSNAQPRTRLPRKVRHTAYLWYCDKDRDTTVAVAKRLRGEYETLLRMVTDANPYFWPALVDALARNDTKEPDDLCNLLSHPTPGSRAEADRVVYQSIFTWRGDINAIALLKQDTSDLPNVIRLFNKGKGVAVSSSQPQPEGGLLPFRDTGIALPLIKGDIIPEPFYPLAAVQKAHHVYRPPLTKKASDDLDNEEYDIQQLVCATAGVCKNEGELSARAAWAVTCMTPTGRVKAVSGRLEERGPFGQYPLIHPPTTIRAQLRAAVAALRMLFFRNKGIAHIVVATESTYVAMGATAFATNWMRNERARTNDFGTVTDNRDLWMLLLGEIQDLARRVNLDANVAARESLYGPNVENWDDPALIDWHEPRNSWMPPLRTPRVLQLSLLAGGAGRVALDPSIAKPTSIWHDLPGTHSLAASAWKCKMEIMHFPGMALYRLHSKPDATRIVLAHGSETEDNEEIFKRLVVLIKTGSAVVLGGSFIHNIKREQLNKFFSDLGLSWKMSERREETQIHRGAALDDHVKAGARLLDSMITNTCLLEGVDLSHVWYSTKPRGEGEVSVAFAEVEEGNLGFVGDIDGEKATRDVVKEMLWT